MGFRETVRAAQRYSDAEASRQASFGQLPEVIPEFTVFKNATLDSGTAPVSIELGHKPRRFDVPVVIFFELAVALGSRLRLNSRGPDKASGRDNLYPRLDIPRSRGERPLNMQVNRIIADPAVGKRVRENASDHRNHLREGLRTDENPLEYGPGKAHTRRWDAIAALLVAYDRADETTRSAIGRNNLEHLLSGLLALADSASAERAMKVARGSASRTSTLAAPDH